MNLWLVRFSAAHRSKFDWFSNVGLSHHTYLILNVCLCVRARVCERMILIVIKTQACWIIYCVGAWQRLGNIIKNAVRSVKYYPFLVWTESKT